MATVTSTANGADDKLREAVQKLADELAGTPGFSASFRTGGDINPQVENITPSEDVPVDESGFLPGQRLNSPLEGPGYGSGESYWSLDTTIPEMTKEQKAASKENEKAAKQTAKDSRESGEKIRKQMEEQGQENQKAAEEAVKEAIARGVIPMGPMDAPTEPDFAVEIVEGQDGSK